ncbi:hypothetical protein [Streptomyces rochei]|uniref:hypothetical protein n=1 Tax=Streptomyces rochei TaxID=1928 RepID=UPI003466E16F
MSPGRGPDEPPHVPVHSPVSAPFVAASQSHDQVEGKMMPWKQPLVLDGEVATCIECGAYRDWPFLSTRGEIWLRCRADHQQLETRIDTAWYDRHSGPADSTHAPPSPATSPT